jgi:hypothetical protein
VTGAQVGITQSCWLSLPAAKSSGDNFTAETESRLVAMRSSSLPTGNKTPGNLNFQHAGTQMGPTRGGFVGSGTLPEGERDRCLMQPLELPLCLSLKETPNETCPYIVAHENEFHR